ncbi:hypothetical protein [Rhodococcus sp. ARC_M6]|uniref:hypothetical protein n=1 Tax=Rhodococcus sp. ARC_M6 TaxID=2928852 RepID=UPI0027DF0FD9|nr:hypothetical protein [Rhodococcus sp. ARC_M6]
MTLTRELASKVPEVTLYFWVIKILGTTVGETAADSLNADLGIGLTGTAVLMTGLLVIALGIQFTRKQYVPWAYWLVVVLISVVGTFDHRHPHRHLWSAIGSEWRNLRGCVGSDMCSVVCE